MKPEGFEVCRDRALGYLPAERPDIRKLLPWGESQNPTIGTTEEKKGATSAGAYGDICHIRYVLFESLTLIMSNSLWTRARACEDGRGLAENSMRSGVEARPQIIAAKARKFQDPQRYQSM